MNPFSIVGGDVSILAIPMRRPFVTALGRTDCARNAVLRLRLRGGGGGWGEASSSVVFKRLSPERLASLLGRLLRRARGRDARDPALVRFGWELCPGAPPAAAAFECALLEAVLDQLEVGMSEWLGSARRWVEGSMTVMAVAPREAVEAAAEAAALGFSVLKIKVGCPQGWRRDAERVLAAERAGRRAGRRPRVLLDGNQRLTESSALRLLDACLAQGIRPELLEQPLPRADVRGMARLRARSPVPLAADEGVRSVLDARRLLDMDAADVLNLKLAKTGIGAALEIMALARAAGKRLMIGCMQESSRGLSASVHLACGTGAFDHVDLDSDLLLSADQPPGTYRREGPRLWAGAAAP